MRRPTCVAMVPFRYPLQSTGKRRRVCTVKRDASTYVEETGEVGWVPNRALVRDNGSCSVSTCPRRSMGSGFMASLSQVRRTTMIGGRVGVRLPDGFGSAVTRTAWTPRVLPGTVTEPVLVVKSADVGTAAWRARFSHT